MNDRTEKPTEQTITNHKTTKETTNNMKIERQDIDDASAMGLDAPHRQMAVEVILKGGKVDVTQNGAPVGQATTIDELDKLLGKQ